MHISDGRSRVIIERVEPQIDCGRFAIKRVPGESVEVEADIYVDGHDEVSSEILHRSNDAESWQRTSMEHVVNDRWHGAFTVESIGPHSFTIEAWVDRFKTWSTALRKRIDAEQDVSVDRLIGADLVERAVSNASGGDAERLREFVHALRQDDVDPVVGLEPDLASLMSSYGERLFPARYSSELPIWVDRERARFSTWYELFPRSMSPEPGQHGTLRDTAEMIPRLASMGVDVLYLPPIHPIGHTFRKGKNNTLPAEPDDHGSPWAIGSEEGGHKDIHPALGTFDDFHHLVHTGNEHGVEIALDIAFQCSPDHPYLREHPEWFRQRPDGTIQYAENPPKKYQDIYPFDFETDAWESLWEELHSVIQHWIDNGVRIFRVDNPHTKSFHFWEWAIARVRQNHPDVIFLSEAFTRPKVMYYLAKLGFNQSYTYFTWRNTAYELIEYMTELTQTEVREYFRPNFWPNTPDILPESLQLGGRPAFVSRLVLAGTLTANYGIYGPAFELAENTPLEVGREEYLHSEKYEIRQRALDQPASLKNLISRVNWIRHENPAFHTNDTLMFHHVDNEELIAYTKNTASGDNLVLVVVNVNAQFIQSGWLTLPLEELGIDPHQPYQLQDLLSGEQYVWHGVTNFVELDPATVPAHIFRIRRRLRTERDFEDYM